MRCNAPQPHLLLPVRQEARDTVTGGGGHCKLGELQMEMSGITSLKAELKFTNSILVEVMQDVMQSHTECILSQPVCPVGKLQGAQQVLCDVISILPMNFVTTDLRVTGL